MSFFQKIQSILDTRLSTVPGISSSEIAWEGTKFVPVRGSYYIRPSLLTSSSELLMLTGGQLEKGIYQIDLFFPTNRGTGEMLEKADAIYDHFKASTKLTSGDVNVYIKQIGRVQESAREEAWQRATIDINFKSYIEPQ